MNLDMTITAKQQSSFNESDAIQERRNKPLGSAVQTALACYFSDLDGHTAGDLYDMVLSEVERPLFEAVMNYCPRQSKQGRQNSRHKPQYPKKKT